MIWTTKQYLLCDIAPGMILGRPVISENGKIIVSENTVLTAAMIQRLREWEVTSAYIKEYTVEESDNVLSFIAEQRYFSQEHLEIVRGLSNAFNLARSAKEVPLSEITELADRTAENLTGMAGVLSHLQFIRSADEYTFRHSVNVGIIVGVMGKWLDIKGQKLKELILAGLIHDIGKTQIPLEVLNKPGKLTAAEREIMQEHTTLGFELVKRTNKLPDSVLLGIWQHHERLDGSGYPFGLSGGEIVETARIIAVADTYDAMISNRVYQKAVTPFKIVEEIFKEMFAKLDPVASTTFLNRLKDSLIGYIVRLSDGNMARVIYLDQNRLIQPVVKVANGQYLDLEKRRDITITEVISS